MWGLTDILRTLAFTLNEMERHCWVLSRCVSRSDLSFHKITGFCIENRLKGNELEKLGVVLRD